MRGEQDDRGGRMDRPKGVNRCRGTRFTEPHVEQDHVRTTTLHHAQAGAKGLRGACERKVAVR